MKSLFLLVLMSVCRCAFCDKKSLEFHAIRSIIDEYFAINSPKIDIICFGNQTSGSEKLESDLLRSRNTKISFKVSQGGKNNRNQLNGPSILIFDSAKTFREMQINITWQGHPAERHQHLVYFPNASFDDFSEVGDTFAIDNVNFLKGDAGKSIELVTSFMFSPEMCHKNKFVSINRFTRQNMRWDNSNFYPNKYQNFHGCPLTVGFDERDRNKRRPTYVLLVEFSGIFNFELDFKYIDLLKVVQNEAESRDLDLINLSGSNGDLNLVSSIAFAHEIAKLTIPPGEPYSELEKVFLPFKFDVWISILATFAISLVTIQVINLCTPKVQNFVFGRNIRTPTMNVLNIFLCGGQRKIPGRNFARFMLMMFIIWSLIIRTCYQSEYFKHLQSDDRKPRLRTISDLMENNFTLYIESKVVFDDQQAFLNQ